MEALFFLPIRVMSKKKSNPIRFLLTVLVVSLFILVANHYGIDINIYETDEYEKLEIPILQNGRAEQIIEHTGYTVSYNYKWNIPNWVAYELSATEVQGEEDRNEHFYPDPYVIGTPVVSSDYSNSGYDRGHMAPAADMKWSEQAMRESFYMTNICPQNHNLNAGDWKALEEYVRNLALTYERVYVCCGPIVRNTNKKIGNTTKIVVPQSFFKVVLLRRHNSWSGIGYVMDNKTRSGKKTLADYAKTINEIEELTNIDFFVALPDDVEERVESQLILSEWH